MTVLERPRTKPDFLETMLKEGIDAIFAGNRKDGEAILRDHIQASLDFEGLPARSHCPIPTKAHSPE
jgi:hypothetical protein